MHNLVSNPQKVPNLKLAESFQTVALTTANNIFNHITAQVVGVLWRPSGSNSHSKHGQPQSDEVTMLRSSLSDRKKTRRVSLFCRKGQMTLTT